MRFLVVLLAVLGVSPLLAQEEGPFFVDEEQVMHTAISAILEAQQDIPIDDLIVERGIDIRCHRSSWLEVVAESNPDPLACSLALKFRVKSTSVEFKYVDKEGKCWVSRQSDVFMVHVPPDGNIETPPQSHVSSGKGQVDCTEEFDAL